MTELTNENLKALDGGLSIWGALGIAAGVIFIIGVIDGFVRPLPCNC